MRAVACSYTLFPRCPLLKESASLIPVPQAQTGEDCACGAAVSELQPLLSSKYGLQAMKCAGVHPTLPSMLGQTQSNLSLLPAKAFPG